MTSTIDNLGLSTPTLGAPATTALSTEQLFRNFVGELIAAVRAALERQHAAGASRFERGGGDGWSMARPGGKTDFDGRTLPSIVGTSGTGATPSMRADRCGLKNGDLDIAALIAQALFAACPTGSGATPPNVTTPPADCPPVITPPVDCGPTHVPPTDCPPATPVDCGPPPTTPTDCPPADGVPPTEGGEEPAPANKKVFVVGNLVKFGRSDGTVRSGLRQLLEAAQGKKQKGAVTNSTLTQEDQARLQKLLSSTDPEVMKVLKSKVPNKKSLVIDEDGRLVATLGTRDQVMTNASLDIAGHKNNRIDRSAGGQLEIEGTKYDVAGTELHSPIKIALDGKDAKLDGKNGFGIDLNGFRAKGGEVKTSGGLNANEAWLVRDREGNGITKNGLVDGNDVYGDHSGKRKDGYDDLARDFAKELKTDPRTGKRYIDLTAPGSRAARELQLLDASGKLRPARDLLTRIEVDGSRADERDAKGNVITARAGVTYKDGRTATSADQWFRTTPR